MKQQTLKNHLQEMRLFNLRTIILLCVVMLLTLILCVRLLYLQVVEHERYTTLSTQNLLNVVPIEPNRGLIYDRNGLLLAENIPVYSLEIIPGQVPKLSKTLDELSELLSLSKDELEHFQKRLKRHRRFESIPLRIKLSEAHVAKFYVNQYRFPGVSVQARLIRHYPLGASVAHALGYVGRLNSKDMQRIDTVNYIASHHIGKIGIERAYEDKLHGQVGYQQVEIDASGRSIRTLNVKPPIAGDDLYLSIDAHLQTLATQAMHGYRGAIVAIQPSSGQILALVSTPSYAPNPFVVGMRQTELQQLQQAHEQPMYNRALSGQYPPGSSIKPFIALGSLAFGMNDANRAIYDPGWFKFKNSKHIYHDWHAGGRGRIKLTEAIIVSNDTYFYDLAVKLGIHNLENILAHFGFGKRSGLHFKEETPGLLPSPEWKLAHHNTAWYPGDTVITGIGQGYMLATPLQLAVATAALANHGTLIDPTLLRKRQPANAETITPPVISHPTLSFKQHDWQTIADAMRGVIENRHGTGHRFGRDAGYSVAAKTGTSQVFSQRVDNDKLPERLRDHSLFLGFAPIEKPEIAIAIVVENDPHAAPVVARKVLDAYFHGDKK